MKNTVVLSFILASFAVSLPAVSNAADHEHDRLHKMMVGRNRAKARIRAEIASTKAQLAEVHMGHHTPDRIRRAHALQRRLDGLLVKLHQIQTG